MAKWDLREYYIKKGYAVIVGNRKFSPESGLPDRKMSEQDVHKIREFCNLTGLTQRSPNNLTAQKMRDLFFTEIPETDFSEYDGFACFISSHGSGEKIFGVDGEFIKIHEIVSHIQDLQSLQGKPKIFFIQNGSELPDLQDADPIRIPVRPDIFICMGTADSYELPRNEDGSATADLLGETLIAHASERNVTEMSNIVLKRMQERCENIGNIRQQVSCYVSTLTNRVRFKVSQYPSDL